MIGKLVLLLCFYLISPRIVIMLSASARNNLVLFPITDCDKSWHGYWALSLVNRVRTYHDHCIVILISTLYILFLTRSSARFRTAKRTRKLKLTGGADTGGMITNTSWPIFLWKSYCKSIKTHPAHCAYDVLCILYSDTLIHSRWTLVYLHSSFQLESRSDDYLISGYEYHCVENDSSPVCKM